MGKKNKVVAINSLEIIVVTSSFNIINWTLTEIKEMCIKVRKLIICLRMHHPRENIKCLNVKRENGERGLIQLVLTNKTTNIGVNKYLDTLDWPQHFVNKQKKQKKNIFD